MRSRVTSALSKLLPMMSGRPPVTTAAAIPVPAIPVPATAPTSLSAGSAADAPKTMRDLLGRTYMLRGKVTWKHGPSDVLELTERNDPHGIDVRDVPEMTAVTVEGSSTRVGAFAPLAAFAPVLSNGSIESLLLVRLRLSLCGAKLVIIKDGTQTTIPLEAYRPDATVLPVSIEISSLAGGFGIAERRRRTTDGDASYELSIVTALRISQLHRFENVRIMVALDGVLRRASDAEALLDKQRFGLSVLGEAALASAQAIDAVDARTSSAARAVAPMVLAALRESVALAKPKEEEPRPRPASKARKK